LIDLVQGLGCAAISGDDRLAPQTHFKDSPEDNCAALRWFHERGRRQA
jgi:acetyl esterase/lipase